MIQIVREAAKEYAKGFGRHGDISYCTSDIEAFEAGVEWQKQQNPWRNFKDERPKPDSHILRKMIHPGYQAYGKVMYYADFWNSDRSDEWKQEDDRVVYEWQYIND